MKQKQQFDAICVGGATRDVFFRVADGKLVSKNKQKYLGFPYGAKINPSEAHFSYGGGAANTAAAMAKLGLRAACFINVGKEGTGDILVSNLKSQGVNTSLVSRDSKLHTAMSFILSSPSGERVIFPYPGANVDLKFDGIRKADLAQSKRIYVTSLREGSGKLLDSIAEIAKKNGAKITFNPGEDQLKRGYKGLKKVLEQTEILIQNKEEAQELAKSAGLRSNLEKIGVLGKKLATLGPEIVVITEGKRGSTAFCGGKVFYQKAKAVKTVDNTGAGDAYGATFTGALDLGYNVEEALKLAALNSASVVSKFGAQEGLLNRQQLVRQEGR